jgi:hypothetical protein
MNVVDKERFLTVDSSILYIRHQTMNTKLFLMAVAVIAAFGIAAIVGPVTVTTAFDGQIAAQNVTGDNATMVGNVTAGNTTGGNWTK